jgi:hypothetical protein
MKHIFFGVVLLCLSCQPTTKSTKSQPVKPVEPTSAPVREPIFDEGTYVVIWSDAVLYRAPREDTEKATMAFSFARETPAKEAIVLRLHREVGEFFEVELLTTEQSEEQCYYNVNSGLQDVSVRLYVKRSEAIPVLAMPVSFSYPDKTSISLSEGVLAQRTASGAYVLHDGEYSFETPLEEGVTGLWFSLSQARARPLPQSERLEISQLVISDKKFLNPPELLWGKTIESQGAQRLFAFDTKCAKYRALFQGNTHTATDNIVGLLLGDRLQEPKHKIASGAALYWSDGAKAGETKAALLVEKQTSATKERACFEVPLTDRIRARFVTNGATSNPSSEKKFFVFCTETKNVTTR